jgi:hypothetical protein
MKLLILCLGLTLVCANEIKNDYVEKNFDPSKVESWSRATSDFGRWFGGF